MGTNYYLIGDVCAHCGRGDERKHIGKSSAGWCFSLHVRPEEGINDLKDWDRLFRDPENKIEDEYGAAITADEMIKAITDRSGNVGVGKSMSYSSWDEFYRRNHAVPGPKGLARHAIGDYCVGHGDGTWDLIAGEFS